MIDKFDRIPTPGKAGWRQFDVVESALSGLPVGATFKAKVDFADDATQVGTEVNRAAQIEFLAASGTTAGTASALTLAQPSFTLEDNAPIRVKFHVNTTAPFSINVNNTGAIPVYDAQGNNNANYNLNTWATFVYSVTLNRWIAQGAGVNPALFAPTNHASSATTYGVANSVAYGHAIASNATPLVDSGSGYVGADNARYAREGHYHPTDNTRYPVAGGVTFTGHVYAQSNTSYTSFQVRNSVLANFGPSGGSSGYLWFQYV